MQPDFSLDHAFIAWENTLKQHIGAVQMEALYKAMLAPANTLQRVFFDLLDKTALDNAIGAQLDNAGSIVGVSREIPESVFIPFFGYIEQAAGVGYGKARYRKIGEAYATGYNLPDAEMRALIKAKIIINTGHGTLEDIIEFVKAMYRVDRVRVSKLRSCHLRIQVGRQFGEAQNAAAYFEKYTPVAWGIGFTYVYSEVF